MKQNYLSHLRTEVLLNLKGLKIQMLYGVLSSGDWLLMRLLALEIGNGSGKKYYGLHSLTMKHPPSLLAHLKDIITSLSFTRLDKPVTVITNLGDLLVTITHISQKKK